jgi:hypothetical protein
VTDSTPLLDLLATYSRRVGKAQLQLLHAATENASYATLAHLIGSQQKLVQELAHRVQGVALSNASERSAHPELVRCFQNLSHGLTQLRLGYEAEAQPLTGKSVATASQKFKLANRSLHSAKVAGHRARRTLGCNHSCRILA